MVHHEAKSLSRRRALLLAAAALPAMQMQANAQTSPPASDPSSDAIRSLLETRIALGHDSVGYVAATVDTGGTRLVTAGQSGADNGRDLDGDTVFEIGSITKVFTALLLADMVLHQEVALTDPVAQYLPPEGRPVAFDGKPITLLDLATYTSGLPRMPGNFKPKDQANPYADYSVAQLYSALATVPPRYYPGSHYGYTNLGFGLLGHALALHAGRSYEDLVVSRICTPLGMDNTRITLTPAMQARLTPGHNPSLQTVSNWDIPTLAGAGALRSTANDLLRFLDACRGRVKTPLLPAFASLLNIRRQTDAAAQVVASGWFVRMQNEDELVWKDGGTGGYSSFIGYSTRSGNAAVLLANTASWETTPRIGWHLINAAYKLPIMRQQITIDPAKLAGLAGHYPLTPEFVLTVTPRDGHLMVQATNQEEYEVFPETDTRFFYRVVDAQLTFEVGAGGTATAVVLHQNGRDRRGLRTPS
jgi:D-alanyl-D-alanine-carboxypeptidase/D-alanyl-D-alanine-endopeptidase